MSDALDKAGFERLLEFLRRSGGVDLSDYRRSSLLRRVGKRMEAVKIEGFDAYVDYLQIHTGEGPALFHSLLINATRFFRDPDVWHALAGTVLPAMLADRAPDAAVRIWSAGTASGEEAYSAAMLLAEQLGADGFRDRVTIFATDVDDQALREARRATYTDTQVSHVPAGLRARYFTKAGGRFTVTGGLRRGVIFDRHDLRHDAPIPRIDLLLCRNALMYFNPDAQRRLLAKLSSGIGEGGVLVLGRPEMLFSEATLFAPIDLQHRIFATARSSGGAFAIADS